MYGGSDGYREMFLCMVAVVYTERCFCVWWQWCIQRDVFVYGGSDGY